MEDLLTQITAYWELINEKSEIFYYPEEFIHTITKTPHGTTSISHNKL